MKKAMLTDIIALLFIFLFIYAAGSKLMDYEKFRAQIGQSPILIHLNGLIAWLIPCIEIIISFLLAFARLRLIGLYGALSLMTMFTGYIIAITRFSSFIPCSCGGILQKMNWHQHLIFNICFVLLASIAILTYSPGNRLPKPEKHLAL